MHIRILPRTNTYLVEVSCWDYDEQVSVMDHQSVALSFWACILLFECPMAGARKRLWRQSHADLNSCLFMRVRCGNGLSS